MTSQGIRPVGREHITVRDGVTEPRGSVTRERLRVGGQRLLVLGVRLEDAVADGVLGRRVGDRTQQCEAAALAVHAVLARRERDVPAAAAAALPDREADQLESRRAGRR